MLEITKQLELETNRLKSRIIVQKDFYTKIGATQSLISEVHEMFRTNIKIKCFIC